MKKIFLSLLLMFAAVGLYAQSNVAYVFSSEIFEVYPKYKEAIVKIDAHVKDIQDNIDSNSKKAKSLFDMYAKFNKSLDSSELNELKKMIIDIESESEKLQESAFGKDGSVEKLKQSLLKPIENQVVAAVEKIATTNGYDMVFDLSIMKNTLYQSAKVNITELVKTELGIQ